MLKYDDMKNVAKRGGVIRWLHSKKVEFLTLEGENIVAFRLLPRSKHVINRVPRYNCVELAPTSYIKIGDLDWTCPVEERSHGNV